MTRAVIFYAMFVLWAGAANAQTPDTFAGRLDGFTLSSEMLNTPSCAFDEDARLANLQEGLCLYHRGARSAEDTERLLAKLNTAQIKGLSPAQQQLASLVSGLARCSRADRHLEVFRSSGQQDLLARMNFCRDRRFALAELNGIRWDHAMFEYAEDLPPHQQLDARLGEMSSCYAGVLDPAFDAECGLITAVTDSELNALVDEAVDDVLAKYFTGVEGPITAMFARKQKRAEGITQTAETQIETLAEDAASVNGEFSAFEAAYLAAKEEKMDPIFGDYRDAILRATAILDEFERWQKGLFFTPEGENLLPKLQERTVEVEEERARTQNDGFEARAASLVDDLRNVLDADRVRRDQTAELCRVYFCELTSARRQLQVAQVCRQPTLGGNPLCLELDLSPRAQSITASFDGTTHEREIVEMCRASGLDPVFLSTGLAPGTAALCQREISQ